MTTEKPIKSCEAVRVSGARTKQEKDAVKLVLSEFFVLINGFWTNEKLDKQIYDYKNRAVVNRENGKRGGRPKIVSINREK